MNFIKQLISYIEKKTTTITTILFSVFVIASLRNIFELLYKFGYLYGKPNIISQYIAFNNFFIHFTSFWIAVFLVLALVLYLFTFRVNNIMNVLKLGMFGMFIIIFPVLFDFIISNKDMMLYPNDPRDLFINIKYYFNINKSIYGLSPGMRYEVFFVTVFSGVYVYVKNHKIVSSIAAGILSFFVIVFFGMWVSFFAQVYEFGFSFNDSYLFTTSSLFSESILMKHWTMSVSLIYIFIILSVLTFVFWKINNKQFIAIVKNFRLNRVFHYLLLFFAGLLYSKFLYHEQSTFILKDLILKNPFDYLAVFGGAISIFLSFQASVIFNDYYDFSVDKISNINRPLITGVISKKRYVKLGIFLVFFALYISYTINVALFFFVLTANFLAFIYSNEPFRLRKYFIINNIIIGLIALTVFHAGASLLLNDRSFTKIPSILSYVIVFGYAIGSVIKDLKDYKGDENNKIQTIFTVLGIKTGRLVFAVLISAAIIVLPLFLELKINIFISFLIVAVFNFILFIRQNNENYIFLFYYFFVILIFIFYFINYISP